MDHLYRVSTVERCFDLWPYQANETDKLLWLLAAKVDKDAGQILPSHVPPFFKDRGTETAFSDSHTETFCVIVNIRTDAVRQIPANVCTAVVRRSERESHSANLSVMVPICRRIPQNERKWAVVDWK